MDRWNTTGDKCGGHYVIGRSGDIYSCFDEELWSNHIGPDKSLRGLNKRSIAVFLCNELFLEKKNNHNYAFGYEHAYNMYKGKSFTFPFKGYTSWADYDEEQINTLAKLLLDISKRWNLPATMCSDTVKFNQKIADKATVVTSGNLDKDSYSLPLPGWVFERLASLGVTLIN
jgi:N-acetyl-anhydromuramyl-L-alanine amidase AmpD